MNEANFVQRVSWLATGDSFLREMPLEQFGAIRDEAGLQLGPDGGTSATAVTPTAVADGLSWGDGEAAILQFMVPLDYDPASDRLAIRFVAYPSADAADTTDLGLTSAQRLFRAGQAVDATAATAVAEEATASTGALVREIVLDISGGGYQPGDVVQRIVDANNGGTTELITTGVSLIYGSTLRMFDDDQNERQLGA